MYDKIKIYVPSRVENIINNDAEFFEFFKKDEHTINRNALLSALISNYHESFKNNQDDLYKNILKIINEELPTYEKNNKNIALSISSKINRFKVSQFEQKSEKLISLKPTKTTAHIISYIDEYLLNNCSLSEYFRNMFSDYASLTQDKRETIIFATQYKSLLKAIKEKRRVFITLRNKNKHKIEMSPYAISTSKEEIHNYLLGYSSKGISSFKISKIEDVTILEKPVTFTDRTIRLLNKIIETSPQFIMNEEESECVIELTEEGKIMFKKYYVHRPTPYKIENNLYYFNSPFFQIEFYFSRFGKEAFVVSPIILRERLRQFYISSIRSIKAKEKDLKNK